MAASLFLTREQGLMKQAFGIQTGYMPGDARDLEITDPFSHTFQWSRRFTGLKVYLALMMYGTSGYAEVIRHQVAMGLLLRRKLERDGWAIRNESPFPVVCFTDPTRANDPLFIRRICDQVVRSGNAWISVYPLKGVQVLRACITNYATSEQDIQNLVDLIGKFR
jgi:glutamate/tyrosine decarboxylase-like PLP-dependent enzyme